MLVDGDVVLPGNLVRNELDWRAVGLNKPDALAARLDRRMSLALTVTDATLFVELGSETLSGTVTTERLPG